MDIAMPPTQMPEKDLLLLGYIESSPIPAFIIGSDHRVVNWNRALEELSRIPAAEVIGTNRHWRAFYSKERPCLADLLVDGVPADLKKWYGSKIRKSDLIEDAYESTDFFPDLEESGRWLRFTAAAIREPSGKIIGAVETLEDITERKLAEAALQESEKRLFRIIDRSPIPAFVIGRDHRVLYWNRALEHLSKIPAAEIVGTSDHWRAFYLEKRPCLADLLVDGDFKKIPRFYARKYGKSSIHEGAYEATDFFPDLGEKGRWLHFTAALIRDSRQQLAGAIETLEDITERKLAEAELFKAREELEMRVIERTAELAYANTALQAELRKRLQVEAALEQTKDRLSLILESLPIISFTCRADGSLDMTFVSSSIEDITGYNPRQFLENPLFWQDHIHPEDRLKVLPEMRVGLKKRDYFKCGYRFRIRDDSFRWFSDYRKLISLPDGTVHVVGALQDVTEDKRIRQEAELRLQQMIQSHKLTALGEVVAGVAHEINNPISFISYNIPMLEQIWSTIDPLLAEAGVAHPDWKRKGLDYAEVSASMKEIIKAFQTASARISRVVTSLKEFAISDDTARKKPVKIAEIIHGALTIVASQVRKTVSQINQDIGEDLPQFQGYPQRIEQVIANLLINAHQSIPAGRKGRISISARNIERLGAVLIEIEDNGKGMERAVLDNIFNPFFTTRRDSGGTGLGLSISYGLVKEHNGTIGVLSRPGLGSRFSIYLPVDKGTKLSIYPAILCVDADPSFLKEIRTNFVDAIPWAARPKDTADAIVSWLGDHPEVDIVMSEIALPAFSGWELFRKLRERFPLLPVILYSQDPDRLGPEGFEPEGTDPAPGPDQILRRPFSFEQLQKKIHEIGRQRL
jgi:PAS domain S-box-containing protein